MNAVWLALQDHADALKNTTLNDLFSENPARGLRFSSESAGLYFDYSKDHLTEQTLALLFELAESVNLPLAIENLFQQKLVNNTENHAALHIALREKNIAASDSGEEIQSALENMLEFAEGVRRGKITGHTGGSFRSIVNLGIGGSELGPKLVVSAFPELGRPGRTVSFVASIDDDALTNVLDRCVPATTLFIVSSKSFATLETLTNAHRAKEWLLQSGIKSADLGDHFAAATANGKAARIWGIKNERIFGVANGVGGRFSLWSAIGLPIALAIGAEGFQQLLSGARAMDEHFHSADFTGNLPVIHGLQAVWHINFRGYKSLATLPYIHRLRYLPAYLQQLTMESLGKSTTRQGSPVDTATGQVIWGGEGTNGQHSFHQLLLQGTETIPVEFVITRTAHGNPDSHRHLVSNCLAQSKALMTGNTISQTRDSLYSEETNESDRRLASHRAVVGNRPSNTLVIEELSPQCLGSLLAFYEHSAYVQSVIWDINPFDQWGVEFGKTVSGKLHDILCEPDKNNDPLNELDSSTYNLLKHIQKK
jgi:glucose-6-phosphate isomerase